jgi:hypothetical protein
VPFHYSFCSSILCSRPQQCPLPYFGKCSATKPRFSRSVRDTSCKWRIPWHSTDCTELSLLSGRHSRRLNVVLITPIIKAQPSQRRFARKLHMRSSILRRSLIPHFGTNVESTERKTFRITQSVRLSLRYFPRNLQLISNLPGIMRFTCILILAKLRENVENMATS